mgnify:CR=1 FL=1
MAPPVSTAVHLAGHEFHGMLYFPPAEHTRDAFALPPLPTSASGARKGPRQQGASCFVVWVVVLRWGLGRGLAWAEVRSG